MASRTLFQAELEQILGSRNVYYQPPESMKLKYPCIIYSKYNASTTNANNHIYTFTQGYQVLYIDPNPDSGMHERLVKHFPMARYDRSYTSDGLNHDSIIIYY